MEVTPDEWTFYMAALIYLWQATWLCYGCFTVCRKVGDMGPMYVLFPVLPPILYVVFSFALACNISWLLIWDREYMEVALVFINLMSCTLYICLVVSLRRMNEFGTLMLRHKLGREIWLIRIFVQNGLAMFASWGTVAAMFNFAVVLTYRTGAKEEVGSTVSLTIFTLEIFAWWVFDNFVFEKLLRYLITPYIVILISIVGIITKNFNPNSTNSIFTVSLLVITAVLTVIKLVLLVYRHYKQPIFQSKPKYRRPMVSFEVRSLLEQQPPHNL